MRPTTFLAWLALAVFPAFPQPANSPSSPDFLTGLSDFRALRDMLPAYLNQKAFALLDARRDTVSRISSLDDVVRRRAYLRERLTRALGGLPAERTPLNARTVATLDRDGYRIEKVIFESQPRFYVTANLYIPKSGRPPYPAILFPLGHESGAKSHTAWQSVLVTVAKRGYVALAWDPVGQGERVQLFDPDLGESKVLRSTTEHSMLGIECLLAGDNIARYTIWDGLRALDYLLSRPEVDPQRVACTGNSGGGTHTAYLSALDDRIQVAAPSCYLTSWRHLLLSIGPQDAEQCLPPFLADGLDHPDFIYAFAPKPYLMLSAIRDFFSISGARETYREAQRVYDSLGASAKLQMVEADDGHGYTLPRRQAAYQWFARWLKNSDDTEPEAPVTPESEETLNVTSTGQVATSFPGETVHSLNLQRARALRPRPNSSQLPQQVRELLHYNPSSAPLIVRPFGTVTRSGYRIEKLVYEPEPGIVIPSLLYLPERPGRLRAVLYVHGRGKAAAAGPSGDLETLTRAGYVVLAPDLRGFGETRITSPDAGSDFPRLFGDYHSAMKALLIGKSLVAMRAEDIARALDLLSARPEVDPDRIYGVGHDLAAVPLLHAALLDPRLKRLALEDMLLSYQSVVTSKIHRNVFESVVQGALKSYDLPDLAAALSPRPVILLHPVDPLGHPVPPAQAKQTYAASNTQHPTSNTRSLPPW